MITDDSNTEWGILRTIAWQKKIPDQSLKTNCKASRASCPSLYDSIVDSICEWIKTTM